MSEKLIIKNFGPIKDIELDLRRVNVFIGDQGTGKTTLGKILCICRYFSYITSTNEGGMQEAFSEWGLEEFIELNTEIHYSNLDYDLSIVGAEIPFTDRDHEGVEFASEYWDLQVKLTAKSPKFQKLQRELFKIKFANYPNGEFNNIPTSFYLGNVSAVMNNPFFLPTERVLQSLFSLGKNSLQNINNALFNQFSKLDSIQRRFNNEIEIAPLGITYKNENGQGRFRLKKSEKFFSMDSAPSGYKTATPIVLIFHYYTEILKKNKSIIFDEPENSLFPEVQKKLVYYIVNKTVNSFHNITKNKFNNQIVLTTHSPYILTSLNNLMYAYTVGQEHKAEVNKIISEKYWLNPNDVSAYLLIYDKEQGGCIAKNIIDEETHLIDSIQIDGVSDVLSEEFNQIMAIKLGV